MDLLDAMKLVAEDNRLTNEEPDLSDRESVDDVLDNMTMDEIDEWCENNPGEMPANVYDAYEALFDAAENDVQVTLDDLDD